MKRIIFYSWQSDIKASVTRNFIEDALKHALKNISRDDSILVEPVLDRDTSGVAGSPAISDTIFAKISQADIFVCDVTIINRQIHKTNIIREFFKKILPEVAATRQTPNPNVLIELGFAVALLGWEKILLIQNTSFGGPDSLPFDLRGRRIVPYSLSLEENNQPQIKTELIGRLQLALKSALDITTGSTGRAGVDVQLWWGSWNIADNGRSKGGTLFIWEIGPRGFLFNISIFDGSRTGVIAGFAYFVGLDSAYARIYDTHSDDFCELSFRRTFKGEREIIVEELTRNCNLFHGMGASFSGTYIRREELLFDAAVLDELDLARLYSITGQFYEPMILRFQMLSVEKNLDTFTATVTVGGVRGLYTIMEGIIMRGENGQLWVAFIDDNDVVRYFTTEREYRHKLPVTIENWRKRFIDKEIVFDSEIKVIPKIH